MTRSHSRAEDDHRDETTISAIKKKHGGETVESIAPEDLESFNDAECKHERLVRDETETEFIAFMCANEKCHEVVLFDKEAK